MNQISHIGDDGWSIISLYLEEHAIESVLLVTGKRMYVASGAEGRFASILAGKRVRRVNEFETNPKIGDILRILEDISQDEPYDAIIAVGGGSVMDVAKLLKAFWNIKGSTDPYLRGGEALVPMEIPLVAVPSTAGSGSEATHFAVVYQEKEKFSIAHKALQPNLAVVIPSLLTSVPAHVAAASGMDALGQAIESYWSIHSTEESSLLAKKAIKLAWASLRDAVVKRESSALERMAEASHLAGRAIDITKTTAPHAVSYALTTFFGVAHGHAVGLLVPRFLEYNNEVTETDCLDARGVLWVHHVLSEISLMLGCADVKHASCALKEMMNDLGLQTNLIELGIAEEKDLKLIVDNGFNPQRVNNNPRRLTKDGLSNILCSI